MRTSPPLNLLWIALLPLGCAPVARTARAEPVHYPIEGVSSDRFESHPAFDPVTGDFYFVRSSPQFTGWRILRRRCGPGGWGAAEAAPFGGEGVDADPFFSRDGGRFYFISSRADPPAKTARDLDIWYSERGLDGSWGSPVRMPSPVNSPAEEWFPRTDGDGTLYFGSGRPGGFGATDIYQARLERGEWRVVNLGGVSTDADDYEFEPSRDGRFAVLMSGGLLYRVDRDRHGWGARSPLLPDATGFHVGPLLSPSGRTLLFARGSGTASGELFRLALGRRSERWPPSCPPRRVK